MATFHLFISYSQIAVFHGDLTEPFNDWRDAHVRQGFSWRPGSVSFATLEDGETEVEIEVASQIALLPDAVRAIQVPFVVPDDQAIEVASISDGVKLELPPGHYGLLFQTGRRGSGLPWCSLTLVPEPNAVPHVLAFDEELVSSGNLCMEANPA